MIHDTFCSAECEQWDCPQHRSAADTSDPNITWCDFHKTCEDYLGPGLVNSEDFD